MAKQFPRTGKPEAGATKVSLRYLINCYASPAENVALNNPIAAWKNHLEFYTSSFWRVRVLIGSQNPFARWKILPFTDETRLLPKRRNRSEINGCHMGRPIHRYDLNKEETKTCKSTYN
jgi:hypothetical protein